MNVKVGHIFVESKENAKPITTFKRILENFVFYAYDSYDMRNFVDYEPQTDIRLMNAGRA